MDKLIDRLKQPSTWRGIILTAGSISAYVTPELWGIITSATLLVTGLIGVFTDDQGSTKDLKEIANTAANAIKESIQKK